MDSINRIKNEIELQENHCPVLGTVVVGYKDIKELLNLLDSTPTEKQIVKDFTQSMAKAGYNVDQSSALTVLKVILNDLQETSARLKKISALADETLSPPTLGELS